MNRLTVFPRQIAVMTGIALSYPASGQSIWTGSSNSRWSDPNNWFVDGIPPEGGAFAISDLASNSLVLEASHTIGLLSFGEDGFRTIAYELQTGTSHVLAHEGGVLAAGGFSNGTLPHFKLRGHHRIVSDQTWTIGGSEGGAGTYSPTNSQSGDAGIGFMATTDEIEQGSLELDEHLSKAGSGQLSFIGVSIAGGGDIVGTAGSLKFNAGASLPLEVGGTGSIVMQGSSKLLTSSNSGVFAGFSRRILMQDASTWEHDSGDPRFSLIESDIDWGGSGHSLSADANLELAGDWSGAGTVSVFGDHPITLSGSSGGFTGSINNHNTAAVRVAGAFGGSITSNGGIFTVQAPVGGDVGVTAGTFALNAALAGSFTAGSGSKVTGEATVGGNVNLDGVTFWADPSTPAALGNETGDILTLAGSNQVVLSTVPSAPTTFAVLKHGSRVGGAGELDLAGGVANYRGASLDFTLPGETRVTIAPGAVSWNSIADGTWDVNSTASWSGTSTRFFHLDAVTFPNRGDRTINLSGTLMPGVITFTNTTTDDYTLSGSGVISGGASIDKTGSGKVTLGGSDHDYTGSIRIRNGLLVMGSNSAFGHSSGITVESGAQVDINGWKPSSDPSRGYTYTIAGTGSDVDSAGAIVNGVSATSNSQTVQSSAGIKSLILAGDALISSEGRYDIGFANLAGHGSIQGNGHTLSVRTESVSEASGLDGMAFRGPASNINIVVLSPGVIWAEDSDLAFGGAGGTLRVKSGARAGTYGLRTIPTPVFLEGGSTLHNQGGATGTWTGGITLEGNATIRAQNRRIVVAGNIGETGGARNLTKTGNSVLTLAGTGTYSGTTAVSEGTLIVNGSLGTGGTVTVSGNATVGGSGTIGRALAVSNNGTLSPGQSAGALKAGAVTMAAGSRITWEVERWNGQVAGVDWDLINAASITLNPTTSNKLDMTIPPPPADFDDTAKTFAIATSTSAITTFDAGEFEIFADPAYAGAWAVRLAPGDSKTIQLTYRGGGTATPFYTWAVTTYGLTGINALAAGNPDGDGFSNYQEFLFGTSPTAPNGSLSQLTRSGSTLTLRWFQRTGGTFLLQESTTLEDAPWLTSEVIPADDPDQSGALPGYVRKRAILPLGNDRKFFRIQGAE